MAPLEIVPSRLDGRPGRSSVLDPAVKSVRSHDDGSSCSVRETATTVFGCHDTMRFGPRSLAHEIKAGHPLQRRLEGWAEVQETAKLEMQRRVYGVGVPARLVMERQVCGASTSHPAIPSSSTLSNFSMDVLLGLDTTLTPADVFRYANGGVAAPHRAHEPGSDECFNDVSASLERAYGLDKR